MLFKKMRSAASKSSTPNDSTTPLVAAKDEVDAAMFYIASHASNNHRDPCYLRFAGPDGAKEALRKQPWLRD
jgi:hypothetical protein